MVVSKPSDKAEIERGKNYSRESGDRQEGPGADGGGLVTLISRQQLSCGLVEGLSLTIGVSGV